MNNLFKTNIENITIQNDYYRKVIHTTPNMQIVVMSLLPEEIIDKEIHDKSDQFFKIEQGVCIINIYDNKNNLVQCIKLEKNEITIIPKGTYHEVKNVGNSILKLYTIYSPKHHPSDRINITKNDAIKDENEYNFKNDEHYKKINKYKQKIIILNKILEI